MDSDITDTELYALVDGRGGARSCGPQTVRSLPRCSNENCTGLAQIVGHL
jgi:hypothetical protein